MGVEGMTITEVKGFGRQKGHMEIYRGSEYAVEFLPKLKIEIILPQGKVNQAVAAIIQGACTGKIGDGKIFISALDQIVRIRTEEKREQAVGSTFSQHPTLEIGAKPGGTEDVTGVGEATTKGRL